MIIGVPKISVDISITGVDVPITGVDVPVVAVFNLMGVVQGVGLLLSRDIPRLCVSGVCWRVEGWYVSYWLNKGMDSIELTGEVQAAIMTSHDCQREN